MDRGVRQAADQAGGAAADPEGQCSAPSEAGPLTRGRRASASGGFTNGIIYIEIGKFAQARIGEPAWQDVVRQAGVPQRLYYRVADYPDEEAFALLAGLSMKLQQPVGTVLEDFGEFVVPDLLRMSRYWLQPEWRTLEVIANTEQTIHETLRSEGSNTNPPRLRCRRTGPDEVVVTYDSPRRLCSLAIGIIRGLALHYDETIAITQPACMLQGAPACELVVRRTAP
ncbi:MAG: heme NO-binding domain-containing protein [Betaproteobacteria bacterium]